jgi:hypothetical protein
MGLNPISHYNPIIAPPNQNPRSATAYNIEWELAYVRWLYRPKRSLPQGPILLPNIDYLIDATTGFRVLSFMDAFSGDNQIKMLPDDKYKITFVTNQELYCYKVMSFGLKNVGTTYQD